MSESDFPPESPAEGGLELEAERQRTAAALAGLRAAVRQRQAELAGTRGGGGDELALALLELAQREFVQEPTPISPRPVYGGLIVLVRKLAWHLGIKWHARAVWAQQNGFNQVASRLLRELVERERENRRRMAALEARIAELERSSGQSDGETGGSGED